jgi:SAM-dependent methyltransferase
MSDRTAAAPSSFNQHIFFSPVSVFYGTDDGYQDGSLTELEELRRFYEGVEPSRREHIHFVSAVGGLYGLNVMTCWRPVEITFFDINPHAIEYFNLIRRVFQLSSSREDLLARLSSENYPIASPAERLIRENLALKQRGQLDASRGSSYKRSLATSWRYALDHFDETRRLLTEVPLHVRLEGIQSPSFCDFVRQARNLWIYASNIVEFTYSEMRLDHPDNAVIVSVVYPGQLQLLDLAPFGDRPVDVRYEIPLAASAAGEDLIPNETPSITPDDAGRALATLCRERLDLQPNARIVDLGCGWGRLAAALAEHLDPTAEYHGFDPKREHVRWAHMNLMPRHQAFNFHITNLANRIYNPGGVLHTTTFLVPFASGSRDLVVASALFAYLSPEELEAYARQAARILKPGGRFLATFYLLDEESRPLVPRLAPPLAFRFASGPVVSTAPNGAGLAAYDEAHVRAVLGRHGFELEPTVRGTWRDLLTGSADPSRLREDAILARRSQASV